MNTSLVEAYKTIHGYSWIDAQEEKRLEMVALMVTDYLDHIHGSSIDYVSDHKSRALALDAMLYQLNDCFDDFKKNYERELIALATEGMVLNAKAEGTIQ